MPDIALWDLSELTHAALFGLLGPEGPNAASLLLLAFLLDALLGGALLRLPFHPYRLQCRAAQFFAIRLDRAQRGARARAWRGAIALGLVLTASAAAGWAVEALSTQRAWGWTGELVLLSLLVAARRPFAQAWRVSRALKRGGLGDARAAFRLPEEAAQRAAARADAFGMARLAIEDCAENLATGVVGTAFWFLLLGLPGAFAYRALIAFVRTVGGGGAPTAFARFGTRLAVALGFLPSRIAGLLVTLAALFAPTAAPHRGFVAILGATRWPEAAFAGALGLALRGPARGEAWLGLGRARATPLDIGRALLLYATSCLLFAAAVAALAAARP